MEKLKSLFYAAICFTVLAIMCSLVWGEYKDIVELSANGARAVGTVVHYDLHQRRGKRGRIRYEHDHTIAYASHKRIFDLGREHPIGSQFYVLYSTRNPDVARITTTAEQSPFALAKENVGLGGLLFAAGFMLVFAFAGVVFTMDVFGFGSKDEEKTQT